MTLKEKLSIIQQELKAPKNLYNSFGGYSYRNSEGILEAFKPYEDKYKVGLILSDNVSVIGDRVYVTATALLYDCESAEEITVSAFAREAISKKGMDDAQVTGATSSYARKYALNGLFLLDDTKDPDTDEYHKESESRSKRNQTDKKKTSNKADDHTDNQPKVQNEPTPNQKDVAVLRATLQSKGINENFVCKLYKIESLEKVTDNQYGNILKHLDDIKKKQEETR